MQQSLPSWPIRSVVFDLDGLLIDSEPIFEEAARRLLGRRGKELRQDAMRAMMGAPAREALPLFRDQHHLTDALDVLAAEYRGDFFAVVGQEPIPLMPGALTLLDLVQRKAVPRAIATSSTAAYVRFVLEPHGLLSRFDFVLSADDVRQGKPHPEIYEKAAARLGHAPGLMLVLEDSVNGMKAAKAAGARCIVVPHELTAREELTAADGILPRLDAPELLKLVANE
jgi:beta-phosphoglucomutase-like phosphatase (HAD superfamily)